MTHKVSGHELNIIRNEIKTKDIIFALKIPWKMDDQKCRFACPLCEGFDTALHPSVNLGRCFTCQRNFNSIDLVMLKKKCQFRTAVEWLRALRNLLQKPEANRMMMALAKSSRMI